MKITQTIRLNEDDIEKIVAAALKEKGYPVDPEKFSFKTEPIYGAYDSLIGHKVSLQVDYDVEP